MKQARFTKMTVSVPMKYGETLEEIEDRLIEAIDSIGENVFMSYTPVVEEYEDEVGMIDQKKDVVVERCENCKHRYALKKFEYSKFGCADTDMPGYICMAFADEGLAIWMAGSSGNGCECFSPKKKTSYHPTESELKIRNYCRENAANIKIKKEKVDMVEVVWCKDCKRYYANGGNCDQVLAEWFCADGERRTDDA